MSEPVQRPLDAQRIERHWGGIQSRRRQRRRSRRIRAAAAATLVVGVALGVGIARWWSETPAPAAWEALAVETGADVDAFELGDGTEVRLAPRSRLVACEGERTEICVRLQRGRAAFDVAPRSERAFRVRAGEVEVRVVGTRFSVERHVSGEERRVRVQVQEGVVEVSAPGTSRLRLEAGRTWSTELRVHADEHASAKPVEPGRQEHAGASTTPAARGSADASEASATQTQRAPRAGGREDTDAPATAERRDDTTAAGTAERHDDTNAPDARTLWARAMEAKRSGDYEAEEQSYEALLRRFPADVRAGQAAFELGRLRMDALGDPRGAIAPLRRAVGHGQRVTFHQDALARLVRAYDSVDRSPACRDAQQHYLERYPDGSHARVVTTLCGGQ